MTSGKTIIVRNQFDSIGRITHNRILIGDEEKFNIQNTYNKTRIEKQTLSNGDEILYEYGSRNNIISKTFV